MQFRYEFHPKFKFKRKGHIRKWSTGLSHLGYVNGEPIFRTQTDEYVTIDGEVETKWK